MTPTFTIDQDGITITLTLDSQYEKAVAKMMTEFEVVSTKIVEEEYLYHVSSKDVKAIRFRLNRKETPDVR